MCCNGTGRSNRGCRQTRRSGCGCGCNNGSNGVGPTATLALNDLQSYVIVPTSVFQEDNSSCGCDWSCNCGCTCGCDCGCDW